jgi:hypothetical protein
VPAVQSFLVLSSGHFVFPGHCVHFEGSLRFCAHCGFVVSESSLGALRGDVPSVAAGVGIARMCWFGTVHTCPFWMICCGSFRPMCGSWQSLSGALGRGRTSVSDVFIVCSKLTCVWQLLCEGTPSGVAACAKGSVYLMLLQYAVDAVCSIHQGECGFDRRHQAWALSQAKLCSLLTERRSVAQFFCKWV